MKYKLLKEIPGVKAGTVMSSSKNDEDTETYDTYTLEVNSRFAEANPEFFEPINEKKKFEDLKDGDKFWYISVDWDIDMWYFKESTFPNYSIFLTEHDAEMERLRREARANVYLPKDKEENIFVYSFNTGGTYSFPFIDLDTGDYHCGNYHVTREDAEEYGRKYAKAFEIPNE